MPPTPQRSRIMSAIRSTGNKTTERRLALLRRQHGFTGWRRHLPLSGRPDFAFRRQKVAVFVDGCFWHGCPRCYIAPRKNRLLWAAKIRRNQERDRGVGAQLRSQGWQVIRTWEHCLDRPAPLLRKLKLALERRTSASL